MTSNNQTNSNERNGSRKSAGRKPGSTTKTKASPVRYTPQLADSICARLAEGESLNAICKSEGMPHESSVRGWVLDDHDGFATKYARARELQAHKLAEEILQIADTTELGVKTVHKASGAETTEGDMIEHRRLRVDARKWYLSKVLPKVYGDKLQAELTGKDGNPLAVLLGQLGNASLPVADE